jgi:hypothetical protein
MNKKFYPSYKQRVGGSTPSTPTQHGKGFQAIETFLLLLPIPSDYFLPPNSIENNIICWCFSPLLLIEKPFYRSLAQLV